MLGTPEKISKPSGSRASASSIAAEATAASRLREETVRMSAGCPEASSRRPGSPRRGNSPAVPSPLLPSPPEDEATARAFNAARRARWAAAAKGKVDPAGWSCSLRDENFDCFQASCGKARIRKGGLAGEGKNMVARGSARKTSAAQRRQRNNRQTHEGVCRKESIAHPQHKKKESQNRDTRNVKSNKVLDQSSGRGGRAPPFSSPPPELVLRFRSLYEHPAHREEGVQAVKVVGDRASLPHSSLLN